jgi:hypothetical protein
MSSEQFRFPVTEGRFVPCIHIMTLLFSLKDKEGILTVSDNEVVNSSSRETKYESLRFFSVGPKLEQEEKIKRNNKAKIKRSAILIKKLYPAQLYCMLYMLASSYRARK